MANALLDPPPPANMVTSTGGISQAAYSWFQSLKQNLSSTQQTADQAGSIYSPITRTLIAATTRSLALTDAGNVLWNNTGGAVTLTIPTHASVALPVNTQIDLLAWNTTITVAAAGGITLESPNSLLTVGPQFAGATLVQVGTDVWALFGALQ